MTAKLYRKKPIVIEAIEYTQDTCPEVHEFIGLSHQEGTCLEHDFIYIDTLEGTMEASVGDFVIKGVNGEFYPCKPDIFDKTYEPSSGFADPVEAFGTAVGPTHA